MASSVKKKILAETDSERTDEEEDIVKREAKIEDHSLPIESKPQPPVVGTDPAKATPELRSRAAREREAVESEYNSQPSSDVSDAESDERW